MVLGTRGFPGIAGGIERHCEGLYPALCRLGCRVQVLARRWCFPPGARLKSYDGVALAYLPAPRASALETLFHTAIGVLFAGLVIPLYRFD